MQSIFYAFRTFVPISFHHPYIREIRLLSVKYEDIHTVFTPVSRMYCIYYGPGARRYTQLRDTHISHTHTDTQSHSHSNVCVGTLCVDSGLLYYSNRVRDSVSGKEGVITMASSK